MEKDGDMKGKNEATMENVSNVCNEADKSNSANEENVAVTGKEEIVLEKEELRKRIGINIMNRRVAVGLSMEELSELMGFSPSFIGLMERGSRGVTAYNIHKLAKIFNCGADDFFEASEAVSEEDAKKSIDTEVLQNKLMTLAYDLGESELKFIIKALENMKTMHGEVFGTDNY